VHRPLRIVVALASFAVRAGPARAEGDARAEAAGLQSEGLKALDRGDAAAGLEKFRAAYALVPSPKVLFNMGRAYAELGRQVEAFECYDRFLGEATNVPPASLVDAEHMRSTLRAKLGFLEVTGPAGATISVDGARQGVLPLPRPIPVAPGRRAVRVQSDDSLLNDRTLDVAAGNVTRLVVAVRLKAVPAPVPTAGPRGYPWSPSVAGTASRKAEGSPSLFQRWWFWPSVATVVLAGVAAGVLASGSLAGNAGCPAERRCM
jgi:hypothetical protein